MKLIELEIVVWPNNLQRARIPSSACPWQKWTTVQHYASPKGGKLVPFPAVKIGVLSTMLPDFWCSLDIKCLQQKRKKPQVQKAFWTLSRFWWFLFLLFILHCHMGAHLPAAVAVGISSLEKRSMGNFLQSRAQLLSNSVVRFPKEGPLLA